MISFVICTHSERADNLSQMLRLMKIREASLIANVPHEFIIVCQDKIEPLPGMQTISMRLSEYRRPLMCNIGVKISRYGVCALLDGDRILPENYFLKSLSVLPKEVITPLRLYQLTRPHTDDEINAGADRIEDFRSKEGEMFRKNAFSGNSVFRRENYLGIGGMDEEYWGYGFNDNDMHRRAAKAGFSITFTDDEELHLWHPPFVTLDGKIHPNKVRLATLALNGIRYCIKWNNGKIDDFTGKLLCDAVDVFDAHPAMKNDLTNLLGQSSELCTRLHQLSDNHQK